MDLRRKLAKALAYLMARDINLDTQAKVATAAGIAQSTVGRILSGETAATLDNIEALSRAFSVTPYALLSGEPGGLPIEFDLESVATLPPQDKARIADFIRWTISQQKNPAPLTYQEMARPDPAQVAAMRAAAERPITRKRKRSTPYGTRAARKRLISGVD